MAADTTSASEDTAPPAAKSGLGRMLPAIGGIIAGLALGGILGFTMLGPKLASKKSAAQTPATAEQAAAASKDSGAASRKGEAPPPIYQIDNLVMNPAASGGTHFLLMSVALQVRDAGSLETLKGRDAELRDAILRLFSRKTIDEISDISARDKLGAELMTMLARMFGDGTVTKIYFPQFVIQ